MAPNLSSYFTSVDSLSSTFITRLQKAVAIPSVSAEPYRRPEVLLMAEFLKSQLESLGAHMEARPLGAQPTKPELQLPPAIIGRYPAQKVEGKRTVLVYGHYDVQPAERGDGWNTDPWLLTEDEQGRMWGRGSTDDKGPVLGWVNVIQAHQKAGLEFPVNLLMCFEGMEESGSEGLDEFITAECKPGGFFEDTEAVCISDNYWLGTEQPCLTYGLRGVSAFGIEVSGPKSDLHSGVYGGTVQEPMTDLIRVMATLVDTEGKILIPGINELVAPLKPEEAQLYDSIKFSVPEYQAGIGSETTIYDDKERTLMGRWRNPSLSLHGIEGAFSGEGVKTVIPRKVTGKFSIRTVPDMDLAKVTELAIAHCTSVFAKLNSKNTLNVSCLHDGRWWLASPNHWNFTAAAKATKSVYGVLPDMTREGGSIPVTLTFEEATGRNVLLLPMGTGTDGAHSANEKLDRRNFLEGTKLLGAYLHYVAEEPMGGVNGH